MKKTILILVSLLFLTACEGVREVTSLQDRNGIKYEVNSEVGFTGKYVEKYENGQKKVEINYKNGKKEGAWTYWHENGQKKSEENYKNGEIID